MKVLVAADAHIYKTKDGKCWTPKIYGYNFWTRYLEVFDEVRIVARMKDVDSVSEKWMRVDGPRVEIFGIPFYQGPKQLLKKYFSIQKVLKNASNGCQAAIIRMPSQTAYITYKHIRNDMPIVGEIVYDPTDDIRDKSSGFLIWILNMRISQQLRSFCKKANGVSYVTEKTIQEHYPSRARIHGESKKYFESYYSTITLNDNAFTGPRNFKKGNSLTVALSDVAMNTERKGEKTLINAVKIAKDKGYKIKAFIIGDGTKRGEFEKYAKSLGVFDQINFTGLLPTPDAVRDILLSADVFVFPTRAEGLPRGVLEAMAIGMPVLSSPVGGIPEVLDAECLYDPNDAMGYAEELIRFMENPEYMDRLSKTNFMRAQSFRNDILQNRRNIFYEKLKKIAEN